MEVEMISLGGKEAMDALIRGDIDLIPVTTLIAPLQVHVADLVLVLQRHQGMAQQHGEPLRLPCSKPWRKTIAPPPPTWINPCLAMEQTYLGPAS